MEETRTMAGDRQLHELMDLLIQNGMNKLADELHTSAVYMDALEHKLEQMTGELGQMRREIEELKEQQAPKPLKEKLQDAVAVAQRDCESMKQKLAQAKDQMLEKVAKTIQDVKLKGKEALKQAAGFLGVREKLESMRDDVARGIRNTETTLERIDRFAEGVRTALHKPWEWQRTMYTGLQGCLDEAIEKLGNMEKTAVEEKQMPTVVAERSMEYGSEAFDRFMAERMAPTQMEAYSLSQEVVHPQRSR